MPDIFDIVPYVHRGEIEQDLIHGETCDECGFVFLDITEDWIIQQHWRRHVDEKVEAFHQGYHE